MHQEPSPNTDEMLRTTSVLPSSLKRAFTTTSSRRGQTVDNLLARNPDDVVITLAVRSAMTRAKKGAFKDTSGDSLLYGMLKAVQERSGVDPSLVEDISVGTKSCQLLLAEHPDGRD